METLENGKSSLISPFYDIALRIEARNHCKGLLEDGTSAALENAFSFF